MVKEKSILELTREERLAGVEAGEVPEWMTTNGFQMFKSKYVYKDQTVRSTYERIARHAAQYAPDPEVAYEKFFELMWNGWLALSTPVLANMGTERGCPVSCSGGYVEDSIYGFYDSQLEVAMLSKNGFGTSSYLGDIRHRGAPISVGGTASGIKPVLKDHVQVSRDVSQGSQRRGAWAGYIPIDHEDFYEIASYLKDHPDDLNIGWNISKNFIDRLENGDRDAAARFAKALYVKCLTGKGYFFKPDHVNEQNPVMYKEHDLKVLASNLCVTGDTIIETNEGKLPISQLEPGNHYEVKSRNLETGKDEFKQIEAGGITGHVDELIVIELEDGTQLSLTEDHMVYTSNRGYVRAGDLTEEDDLVLDK